MLIGTNSNDVYLWLDVEDKINAGIALDEMSADVHFDGEWPWVIGDYDGDNKDDLVISNEVQVEPVAAIDNRFI